MEVVGFVSGYRGRGASENRPQILMPGGVRNLKNGLKVLIELSVSRRVSDSYFAYVVQYTMQPRKYRSHCTFIASNRYVQYSSPKKII